MNQKDKEEIEEYLTTKDEKRKKELLESITEKGNVLTLSVYEMIKK